MVVIGRTRACDTHVGMSINLIVTFCLYFASWNTVVVLLSISKLVLTSQSFYENGHGLEKAHAYYRQLQRRGFNSPAFHEHQLQRRKFSRRQTFDKFGSEPFLEEKVLQKNRSNLGDNELDSDSNELGISSAESFGRNPNRKIKTHKTEVDKDRCYQRPPHCSKKKDGRLIWTYDRNIETCRQFTYYGCGSSTSNRFYSLFGCEYNCIEKVIGKEFSITEEKKATEYLERYSNVSEIAAHLTAVATFAYDTNISEVTASEKIAAIEESEKIQKNISRGVDKFNLDNLSNFTATEIKNIKEFHNKTKFNSKLDIRKNALAMNLSALWGSTKMCMPNNPKDCFGNQEVMNRMKVERDYDTLLDLWKGWRDAIGSVVREPWMEHLKLANQTAHDHGYSSLAEKFDEEDFDDRHFSRDVDEEYYKLLPLYKQLHAYVRARLRKVYGKHRVSSTGPIPAHLLGDVWAQQWHLIFNDILIPYPEIPILSDDILSENNVTTMKMVLLADKFYQSLGFDPMTDEFFKKSMFIKPKDREVVCYASAHHMYAKCRCDFRIKMCMNVDINDFSIIHHEMGHIQYYMCYARVPQPYEFQTGGNAAFHEAVGDTMTLSVLTEEHLENIGFLPRRRRQSVKEKYKKTINYLMQKALYRLVVIPWAYTVEKWRYGVFKGHISPDEYNKKWWEIRNRYQGILSPIPRNETIIDAFSKYHIVTNTPYYRYMYSFILQFQWHETLCKLAGHPFSLHSCDIYKSKKAGRKFKSLLEKGASEPWKKLNKDFTGSEHMSASSMIRYFELLYHWLKIKNKNEKIGWE